MKEVLRRQRRDAHRRCRQPRPSGCASGAAARTPFPAVGSHQPRLHTAWTRPSRASAWPTSCWRSRRWRRSTACAAANVFHAGDGNLHPLILFDANDPDSAAPRPSSSAPRSSRPVVAMGGTVTGEHGVGVEKLNQMCAQFDGRDASRLSRVKRAFDPAGLLNPGKVMPTLAALRRIRQDACARRAAAVSGPAALLT